MTVNFKKSRNGLKSYTYMLIKSSLKNHTLFSRSFLYMYNQYIGHNPHYGSTIVNCIFSINRVILGNIVHNKGVYCGHVSSFWSPVKPYMIADHCQWKLIIQINFKNNSWASRLIEFAYLFGHMRLAKISVIKYLIIDIYRYFK